ncbi:MAG: hypothetical protein P9M13_04480 [Candidatus Ancaeobacter aquaticus]|nr:hypothetical protein [Candidatus Ancaeobacter aquaticus]
MKKCLLFGFIGLYAVTLIGCCMCQPEKRVICSRIPDAAGQTIQDVHSLTMNGEYGEMPVGEEDILR